MYAPVGQFSFGTLHCVKLYQLPGLKADSEVSRVPGCIEMITDIVMLSGNLG